MPNKYLNKLEGKRVVVVGGTSGIGFAAAEAAVEYGAIVTVASSNQAKVDRAVERLRESYPDAVARVRGKTLDLSDDSLEEKVVALYEFAAQGNKLDHIIETAGDVFGPTPLSEFTPEKSLASYKLRLTGSIILAKVALRFLNMNPTSSFTLTSGVADSKPQAGWAGVAPTAAAKKGLMRSLTNDLKPVRVNCVCPGAVKTEMYGAFGDQVDAFVEMQRLKTLTGTIGKPEDLAECYLSIMKNYYINGAEIYVDGGFLLH